MAQSNSASERIPFYRNARVLAILAQVIFLLLVVLAAYIVYRNITLGVEQKGIRTDFGFLDDRAGFDIGETPISYSRENTYGRAIIIGILNTLRVSLVGVVLATFLGIGIALLRLSQNWILRQIANVYIETVRNIPLVVQIFFWLSIVLLPSLPIGENAIELPGGVLLNNGGLALPWLFPSHGFSLWLPWLLAALIVFLSVFFVRKRQIKRSERPGNPWVFSLLGFFLLTSVGYLVANNQSAVPDNAALDFRASNGRIRAYIDEDGDGSYNRNLEPFLSYTAVQVEVDQGRLKKEVPGRRIEIRREVESTFRFPILKESEFDSAKIVFEDPKNAENLSVHYDNFPSIGRIYNDRNQNGVFDAGEERRSQEEIDASGTDEKAYIGQDYVLFLELTNFKRTIVVGRDGQAKIPSFEDNDTEVKLNIIKTGPLVLSKPSIPRANFVDGGGVRLTTFYLALLLALVVYTASFIAEIVRGGILAVVKGQREAAKALGLNASQTFRLIVFPQAMRIIIPPLISQYLNLTKNSSLAFFASYPEFLVVSRIVENQTGAALPVTVLLIAGYLSISLTFSVILNIYNNRVSLVER